MKLLTNAPKGTQDILNCFDWQVVERVLTEEALSYGFSEIRTPVFEHTELFLRSVGETTDVVQKEMYTFQDKGNRSITLRPEGTAGAVRAFLERGLFNGALPVKRYYLTSCYRYENKQAGRLREFHQFGAEVFGAAGALADAELIAMAHDMFERLGLSGLSLEINSIGCPHCRPQYHKALLSYLTDHQEQLCTDCKSRMVRNPMRTLDCKVPACREIVEAAPQLPDFLCADCKTHFERVQAALDSIGIAYRVNPSIVRGLDYYTRTVFEFVAHDLKCCGGESLTVCGGGRYDGLIEQMGGAPTPALGFAIGLERLLLVLEEQGVEMPPAPTCEVYLASMGEAAQEAAFRLAHELRQASVSAECDLCARSLKAQLKYADKIGAQFALVLGENELEQKKATLKRMETGETFEVRLDENFLHDYIKASCA